MEAGLPKAKSVLYSKAETTSVGFSKNNNSNNNKKTNHTHTHTYAREEDPEGRKLPYSDHILSESDGVFLSVASHVVRIEWCSLLLRQFLLAEASPACNQSRQTPTVCDLTSSWKPPLPTLSVQPLAASRC